MAEFAIFMVLLAGAPIASFRLPILVVLTVGVLAVLSSPSRVSRIAAWLNPAVAGEAGQSWQFEHGTWALAAGGLFGVGLGQSKLKWNWIPEVENDFIFAIIGEELPFADLRRSMLLEDAAGDIGGGACLRLLGLQELRDEFGVRLILRPCRPEGFAQVVLIGRIILVELRDPGLHGG